MSDAIRVFSFLDNLVLNTGQSFDVCRKFKGTDNEFHFTSWVPYSEWKSLKKGLIPNYREILQNEIVFESDLPTEKENRVVALEILSSLEEKNLNFWCVFTGSKSYHIHLLCDELLKVDREVRPKVREFFAKSWFSQEIVSKLDFKNFDTRRLIQIEVATNPKTEKEPEVLREKIDGIQPSIPAEFFNEKGKRKYELPSSNWKRDLIPKKCDALEYCLVNKVPSGNFTRYEYISSSLSAYIRHKKNREELAKVYYKLQGKSGDLEAWDKKPSNFNCNQVRKFMEKNGFGKICEKCLLSGDVE
jgi:hypothetical protein